MNDELTQQISLRVTPKLKFDPISIINIFLPLLMQCISSEVKKDPQSYLRSHYSPEADKFDRLLIVQSRGQARKANRIAFKQGNAPKRVLTADEADDLSHSAFMEIMEAPTPSLKLCMETAASVSIEE